MYFNFRISAKPIRKNPHPTTFPILKIDRGKEFYWHLIGLMDANASSAIQKSPDIAHHIETTKKIKTQTRCIQSKGMRLQRDKNTHFVFEFCSVIYILF